MADIRDWPSYIRSRWNWTGGGYERGFPRGCQFTDIDALVEFNGRRLVMETKSWDGESERPPGLLTGQRLALEVEGADRGKSVFVVYGCGVCNDPMWVTVLTRREDPQRPRYLLPPEHIDLRPLPRRADRRRQLKELIDQAMGVSG